MNGGENYLRHELCHRCLHYARHLRVVGIPFGTAMKQHLQDYLLGLLDGIEVGTRTSRKLIKEGIKEFRNSNRIEKEGI